MTGNSYIAYDAQTHTYLVEVGASTADIENTINKAESGATILLSTGTHVLDERLDIKRGDITLSGSGENETTVLIKGTEHREGIRINGGSSKNVDLGVLGADVKEGSTTITLKDGHDVKAGDVLHISQENDSDWFLNYGPNDQVYKNEQDSIQDNPLRESLVEVASVDGNVVTLKHKVAYDMDGGIAKVEKYHMLDNITLKDFSVTYDLGQPDDDLKENTLKGYEKYVAIQALSTTDLAVENITVENAASHALELRRALEADVDNFTADGAHNKGGSKNGYGIHVKETFYSNFDNLELYDMRHSFVFSSWSGEAYNDVHISSTNRDINFHGSPDHSNTVVVDEMLYDNRWGPIWMYSPRLHPHTELSDNIVLFDYVRAGDHDDILHGDDSNAYLNGGNGDDVLIGGDGNDVLVGGLFGGDHDHDILFGGLGNDNKIGYEGNDLYGILSGQDRVFDTGGYDVITFDKSISFDDLSFVRSTEDTNDLLIQHGNGHQVEVENQLASARFRIEELVFADGLSVSFDNALHWVSGTDSDDIMGVKKGSTLLGNGGDDMLYGSDWADEIFGGIGNDYLRGNGGDDILYGGSGDDRIRGYAGDDTLFAGSGKDLMTGYEGADTFVLWGDDAFDGMNFIRDFSTEEGDVIDIRDVLIDYDPVNDDIGDFISARNWSVHTRISVDRDGNGDAYSAQDILRVNYVTDMDIAALIDTGNLNIS